MRVFKRINLLLAVFSLSAGALYGQDSLLVKRIDKISIETQQEFAPDKRTAVFNVTVENNNGLELKVESDKAQAIGRFRKRLTEEGISLPVKEELLPSSELGGRIYGVASLSVCNNRAKPANSAEMVSQTLLGTPAEVLKKERGYYLIRTPDGYISWTDDAGIQLMNRQEFDLWKSAAKVVFTAEFGHSFSEASLSSLPVSDLVAGNMLNLLSKEKQFYKVAYPDGRIAYIPLKQAEPYTTWAARPNPDANQIIATAKTLIGVPYLWGGTSIKGVDCSGFTRTSYFLNGILLARDASQQALTGEKVDIYQGDSVSINKCLSNLKPGDLLFFTASRSHGKPSRITHTAIYLGNGELIQSAGLVRINSMIKGAANYDDFQTRTLVSARRILTSIGTEGISRINEHPFYNIISK